MLSVKMYFYSLGDALDKPQPIDPITPEISFKLNIPERKNENFFPIFISLAILLLR